jgi:O-antigen ligase
VVASLGVIAWGALAFGAVYRWAYIPLGIGCAAIGVAALVLERRSRLPIRGMTAGLAAIGLAMTLQLVPFSPEVLERLSPGTDSFLRQSAFSNVAARHAFSLSPDRTALGLALFTAYALLFLGMARLLSAVGGRAVVRPLVAFGAALALFGVIQYTVSGGATYLLKIYGFWQPRYRGSPFGPFVNRNHFAGWMIMVLPLALAGGYAAWEQGTHAAPATGFQGRLAWLSSPSAAGVSLMAFAALVMGLSLLMSQSRSGMAAFAAGIAISTWIAITHQVNRRARLVVAAAMAAILVGATAWAGFDRTTQRVSSLPGDISTAGGRLQAWSDTTRIIRDFPATGTGLNTYGTAMVLYQSGDRSLHFQEAHNDYLQLAAEGGLLIGLPVLFTLGIFVRDVRRRFKEAPKQGTTYWLRVGAVIGLVSIALQSLVEFSLQMPGNAAMFAMLGAIALHRSPNLRPSARSGDSH